MDPLALDYSQETGISISKINTLSFGMIYALHLELAVAREEYVARFLFPLISSKGLFLKRVRSGPILSPQVKAMIGEGNVAFVDNDIPTAIRIMQEVIRIEPRAASAWSVLAQCYADTGEPKRELQLRIMAAHLRHDADEWERLAVSSKYVPV